MEKKSTNAIVIAVSVLAVCVVAVVCALIIKANGSGIIKTQSKEKNNALMGKPFKIAHGDGVFRRRFPENACQHLSDMIQWNPEIRLRSQVFVCIING